MDTALRVQVVQLGPHSSVAEKAAWALYDACLDNPMNWRAVREAGGVPPLVALLAVQQEGGGPAASAAWALLQLSAGDDANAEARPYSLHAMRTIFLISHATCHCSQGPSCLCAHFSSAMGTTLYPQMQEQNRTSACGMPWGCCTRGNKPSWLRTVLLQRSSVLRCTCVLVWALQGPKGLQIAARDEEARAETVNPEP